MPSNWSLDPVLKAARATAGIHKQCSAIRERLGLTRETFATMMGYPCKKLQKIESGGWPVNLEILHRLAELSKANPRSLYKIDPHHLADAESTIAKRKVVAAGRRDTAARKRTAHHDRGTVPTGAAETGSIAGDKLADALNKLLGNVDIQLLPPTVVGGAHLATARIQGRPAQAASGFTKGEAIAKAIELAQAEYQRFDAGCPSRARSAAS